jgi:hypothetical protein
MSKKEEYPGIYDYIIDKMAADRKKKGNGGRVNRLASEEELIIVREELEKVGRSDERVREIATRKMYGLTAFEASQLKKELIEIADEMGKEKERLDKLRILIRSLKEIAYE